MYSTNLVYVPSEICEKVQAEFSCSFLKLLAIISSLSCSEYVTRTALSHTLYSSESFQPIITLLYELRSKIARLPIESSTNYTDELNELINRIEVK